MSIQNLLQDIEKRRGTPKPSLQERARRIGKGAVEFIAPTRGYTQEEIKTAKPTLKEKFTGPAKVAGEIGLGLASIGQFAMSKLPVVGKKYAETTSPEYMARLQEKVQPKTPGEAQAMQFTDVATLGAGAITKNVGREALERIAKETDPVKIAGIVKDTVPQLAEPNVLTRIAPNLAKTQDVNEVQKIIDVAIKSKNVVPITFDKTPEKGFSQSKNQIPVGNSNFVIGEYGKNTIERKIIEGKPDRLPESELTKTIENIKDTYKAGTSSFRKDNLVHVATMPDGEMRAIVSRLNKNNQEEIINFFKVGKDKDKFIQNLKQFGIPERTRTSNLIGRNDALSPLSYGDTVSIAQKNDTAMQPVSKQITPIDRLISEGKVRVVSRDGRDVYQVKKGDTWVNKRDEDSAVKYFEPKPKPAVPEVAPELNERLVGLMAQKEMLDAMPEKQLAKFAAKTGEEKGTLREVTGQTTGKFANEGDQIVSDLGFESTEAARDAYVKYQNRVADITADIQNTKDAIKSAKQRAQEQRKIEKMQSDLVDTQVPKSGKTRAEVKSLEEVASRTYDELALPPNKMPLSLEEIVTQTPLKAKVNLLDYIRTPEKVLKKIGFAEEAKLLRKKYDDYVVELPKNIDKITKWVDQVPKDANERIFRYLDGKENPRMFDQNGKPYEGGLSTDELRVANEIKVYLKEWAVRLKLPEDKRITNYITHLFDEELIAKEFDEDLAKIIAEKLPGEVYDPFLQKRLGAQGYRQDVWAALDAYTKRATRKAHIDEALQKIQDKAGSSLEFSNIEKSQFEYIKNYVDRVNMRPTRIDELLDTGIKQITGYKLGQRPINRVSGLMRRVTYRGMLGANLGSALRNLSQGVNTYAVLGERDFALGYMKLFSEKARNEMVEQGIFSNTFIQDRSISATKKALEKADKALWFFFDAAEKVNRGAAYMGAKTKGLRNGMNEEEAIDYAKSIVRKTQFNYDPVDTPVALSSDLVKTLAQFQTYTVKQSEFLLELAADRNFGALARYVVGGLAFVYTIGQAFGMEEKELAPMFRFDGPPSLKFPIELAKAAFGTEDEYGNERDLEKKIRDVSKTLWGYVPGGMQLKKTIQGAEAVQEGGSYDIAGRKQFEVGGTPEKDLQAILFGKYAGDEAKQYFEKGTGDKELDKLKDADNKAKAKERERVKEEVQNLRGATKEEAKARLLELAKEDEALAEKVVDALLEEKQGLSATEKTLKNSTVKVRAEYIKSQMDDLDTDEEKKQLLKEYAEKGILTESVLDEIIKMKE